MEPQLHAETMSTDALDLMVTPHVEPEELHGPPVRRCIQEQHVCFLPNASGRNQGVMSLSSPMGKPTRMVIDGISYDAWPVSALLLQQVQSPQPARSPGQTMEEFLEWLDEYPGAVTEAQQVIDAHQQFLDATLASMERLRLAFQAVVPRGRERTMYTMWNIGCKVFIDSAKDPKRLLKDGIKVLRVAALAAHLGIGHSYEGVGEEGRFRSQLARSFYRACDDAMRDFHLHPGMMNAVEAALDHYFPPQ